MADNHLVFLIIILIIAAVVRDDAIFFIVYLLAGLYILSRLWTHQLMRNLRSHRVFTERVFCGEDVPVKLQLHNSGWLPAPWLWLNESIPTEIAPPNPMRQVISLGSKRRAEFSYTLRTRKRGYYPIGPLFANTGDLFGMAGEGRFSSPVDHLTVYPRVVQFTSLKLPSFAPMGTLRHTQPIYEDPARVLGKRDYAVGDSLRRVDWKTSAALGRLQVKQYEPSIALHALVMLNMNRAEYDAHAWVDALELCVVIAASLANWVVAHKQSVGLATNGLDPLQDGKAFNPLLPRRGRGHLMRILDVLARVTSTAAAPFVDLVRAESERLPWGTTLLLITGQADDRLFDEMFHARRFGLNSALILVGPVADLSQVRRKAEHFGIPFSHFRNEMDLDIWRQ